jgi:hypothetical protein
MVQVDRNMQGLKNEHLNILIQIVVFYVLMNSAFVGQEKFQTS